MASDFPKTLRFLPVGLDVRGRKCLVIGGGSVGTRKVLNLERAGAVVTVVSPDVGPVLADQIEAGHVHWLKEAFREEHLAGAFLVVAATDDEDLNAAVVRHAGRSGALFCDASSAERSQVIFGALLQSEDVDVAVFTGGRDPAQARRARDRIAYLLAKERGSNAQRGSSPRGTADL
jgi:siroheme synthase-like protein